ncbi:MAG: C40 family peptidase [Lachnospiraceae bacterium]
MKGIANRPIVPLYRCCSEDSERIDELIYGMEVIITEVSTEKISDLVEESLPESGQNITTDLWILVETEYFYRGYALRKDFLLEEDRSWDFAIWNSLEKKRVYQSNADVLSVPRIQGKILLEIPRGGVIGFQKDVPEAPGWIQVSMADGSIGYMKRKFAGEYVKKPVGTEEEIRKKVVETAESYLGTQYRWGGKTPFGIDCSGLTSMSFLLNGILTYRDAEIKEGFSVKEIPFSERQQGDLLYFKGHIALLIDTERFIHSTGRAGSDGVVINSLNPEDDDYREDLAKGIQKTGSVFPLK